MIIKWGLTILEINYASSSPESNQADRPTLLLGDNQADCVTLFSKNNQPIVYYQKIRKYPIVPQSQDDTIAILRLFNNFFLT